MVQPLHIQDLMEANKQLRKALDRQCDNMAFVLNNMDTKTWYEKFSEELHQDRKAIKENKKW